MEQKKLQSIDIIAIACVGVTAVINILAYFLLPDFIITQITFTNDYSYTAKITYLLFVTGLILLTSGLTVFTDRKKKWIAMTAVLIALNILCITLNLL